MGFRRLFFSIESQETSFFVYRLNVASFDRFPTFSDSLRDTQELGRNVIVGAGDWEAQLERNKQSFVERFVNRPEFVTVFPVNLTPLAFVTQLDLNTGLSLLPSEKQSLISELTAGNITRADVLRRVAENSGFSTREFNRAFVLYEYFGYLRRNPDESPDTNFDGYNFWLNKLNQFNGDFERAQMVLAFIKSIEYRQRFGP